LLVGEGTRARSDPYPGLINHPNRGAPMGPNQTVPSGTVPLFAPIPGNKLPGYFHNVPTGQRHLTPVHEFDCTSPRVAGFEDEDEALDPRLRCVSCGGGSAGLQPA
jgi:hypothetical protein